MVEGGRKMLYNALSVAHYIINYCNEQRKGVSNLKLQKLLYFVQAEFLVSTPHNTPCFEDPIEAWDFGPVVPNVYHEYKIYGSGIIPSVSSDPFADYYQKILSADQEMINEIVQEAANYSASQLVAITHNQAPWRSAYRKGFNNIISNESIFNYFKE